MHGNDLTNKRVQWVSKLVRNCGVDQGQELLFSFHFVIKDFA